MADTNKTPSTYARKTPSTDNLRAWIAEAEARKSRALPKGSAAVLIPILTAGDKAIGGSAGKAYGIIALVIVAALIAGGIYLWKRLDAKTTPTTETITEIVSRGSSVRTPSSYL